MKGCVRPAAGSRSNRFGNWTADFSGMADLSHLSKIGSQPTDGEGDATSVFWVPPPHYVNAILNLMVMWKAPISRFLLPTSEEQIVAVIVRVISTTLMMWTDQTLQHSQQTLEGLTAWTNS